jgi:ribonuclease III
VAQRGYDILENRLGYTFQNRKLLENALTHRSYVNENPAAGLKDNQRLELLGDAVLGLCITNMVMDHFPTLPEGALSMARAEIVSAVGVAEVAAGIDLGEWLFLGRGEDATGGRKKSSLNADAMEAVIGAVYLDGGFPAAFEMVKRLFGPPLKAMEPPGFTDFKTRLQERAHALRREIPKYAVTAEFGPDHNKYFEVEVTIQGKVYATHVGKSKKEAEQGAAASALFVLEGEGGFAPEHRDG